MDGKRFECPTLNPVELCLLLAQWGKAKDVPEQYMAVLLSFYQTGELN